MQSAVKKFFLSFFVFAVSAGYVVYQYTGGSPASAAVSPAASGPVAEVPKTTGTPAPTPAPKPKPTPAPVPTPAPAPKPKGQYADGTYTGNTANAYYGYVQVRVSISGGKITDVQFLQYPNDRQTSQYINSQAMPLLKSEAIQAQSANVSGVSGASDTSQAFIESLGNALAQAKNA